MTDAVTRVGALRFAVRPKPGPYYLLMAALTTLASGAGCYFLPADGGWVLAVAGASGLLLVHLLVIGAGMLEQHRVHDHALIVGPVWRSSFRPRSYIIPWETVDPASLLAHRRANFIGDTYGPTGLSSNLRMAVFSTGAVSFVGLNAALAKGRGMPSVPSGNSMAAHRWVLGLREPEPLMRAVEHALLDAGLDAHGAADRALAHPVTEVWRGKARLKSSDHDPT